MKFTLGFMLHTLPIQRVAEYAKKLASNFSEASEIREQGDREAERQRNRETEK